MAGTLLNLFISLRPWSFPATLVPVLLTAALVHKSGVGLDMWDLARAIASGILLQSAANSSNTFWDYINGADRDTVAQGASEKNALPHKSLLVSGALSLRTVGIVSTACYCGSAYLLIPAFRTEPRIIPVYALGVALAIFYTAPPLKLKYHALGDVCVFATFGPMLTYWTLLLICPTRAEELRGPALAYTMPCAFICECILHANNSRDIREDRVSGLTTLATLLGFARSYFVFAGLILASFATVAAMAFAEGRVSMLLVLLAVPMALRVISRFSKDVDVMADLPRKTAALHMVFGVLLIAGVLLS